MAANTAEGLLASYPPDTQALALQARRVLVRGLPGAEESVDLPARMIGYSYGPGYRGMVCTLIPSRAGVKIGFYRGSELPDPDRLLRGTGKVHRHVPLATAADLRRPGLKGLLAAARAACRARLAAR
jgi:hypothetical protein